jgi:two-component system CheB/CheR fusion protein
MTLVECAEALGSEVPIQIFATDLNAAGIATARAAIYPRAIAAEVSAERLKKFFVKEPNGYRICKALRDRCIFSRHNVLGDPPFSRVDFISCRNVLIYMQPLLQQQILPLLHYALKPGGFLWLGSSETAGNSRALFEVVDATHKIYVRQPGGGLPGTRFQQRSGNGNGAAFSGVRLGLTVPPRAQLLKEAERTLLARYCPPGVVITRDMEILHFRGDTAPYLTPAAGAASLNLLKMLREGLLVSVRGAVMRAAETSAVVRESGLRVRDAATAGELSVAVIPLQPADSELGGFLVLFEEERKPGVTGWGMGASLWCACRRSRAKPRCPNHCRQWPAHARCACSLLMTTSTPSNPRPSFKGSMATRSAPPSPARPPSPWPASFSPRSCSWTSACPAWMATRLPASCGRSPSWTARFSSP